MPSATLSSSSSLLSGTKTRTIVASIFTTFPLFGTGLSSSTTNNRMIRSNKNNNENKIPSLMIPSFWLFLLLLLFISFSTASSASNKQLNDERIAEQQIMPHNNNKNSKRFYAWDEMSAKRSLLIPASAWTAGADDFEGDEQADGDIELQHAFREKRQQQQPWWPSASSPSQSAADAVWKRHLATAANRLSLLQHRQLPPASASAIGEAEPSGSGAGGSPTRLLLHFVGPQQHQQLFGWAASARHYQRE